MQETVKTAYREIYHGKGPEKPTCLINPVTGNLGTDTYFGGNPVYQDLTIRRDILGTIRIVVSRSGGLPMDRTADLKTALSFVIQRVEEQARASGYPLNEEEDLLLRNLPSSNVNYPIRVSGPPKLVPRNTNLERLCALAKAAYRTDRETNPESLDWEFAFAVFTLDHHPMWGVLHSAGVTSNRRSSRDGLLMTIAALVPLVAAILVAFSGARLFQLVAILCVGLATMALIYIASRRMEQRQLENHIERCRLGSRNIRWKTS